MSVRTLRWSGWLLLLGSGLFIVGSLPSLVAASNGPTADSIQLCSLILGTLLVVVGLPASYRKQAKQVGWAGRIGFIVIVPDDPFAWYRQNVVFLVSDAGTGGGTRNHPLCSYLLCCSEDSGHHRWSALWNQDHPRACVSRCDWLAADRRGSLEPHGVFGP